MPLCKPAFAALATLQFTWIYNDFFWAVVLMSTGEKLPITSRRRTSPASTSPTPTCRRRRPARGDPHDPGSSPSSGSSSAASRSGPRRSRRWPGSRSSALAVSSSRRTSSATSSPSRSCPTSRSCCTTSIRPARDRGGDGALRCARARRRPRSLAPQPPSALDGADYVFNMVQIGGHEATLLDFEIPARYGLRQTIADTLGIGGIFRTLRTADHMLALGREIAELCPAAWLLNYTNPMAMLCWLVYGGTPTQNVVGLCHSVQYTTEDLAELVGVPGRGHLPRRRAQPPGVHPPLRVRGEDLYPLSMTASRPTPSSSGACAFTLPAPPLLPDRVERARGRVRALVHAARRPDRVAPDPGRRLVRRSEENLVEYDRVKGALARGETLTLERSNEYASSIIHSMETGAAVRDLRERAQQGVSRVAGDCCVEVPCLVDGTGLPPSPFPTSRRSSPHSTARSRTSSTSRCGPCSTATGARSARRHARPEHRGDPHPRRHRRRSATSLPCARRRAARSRFARRSFVSHNPRSSLPEGVPLERDPASTRSRRSIRTASGLSIRISLEIEPGEFVVLVGPSGCGKVDAAADDRRARRRQHGGHLRRRHGRHGQAAAGARHRNGVFKRPTRSTRT